MSEETRIIRPIDMQMVKEYLKESLRINIEEYKEYYSSGVNFKVKLILEDEVIDTSYFDVSFR